MTKIEMFKEIRKVVIDNEEMVTFIDHEIELLTNRHSSKKPTKTQIENEAYKALIVRYLKEVDCGKTIKELQAGIDEISGLTNQRITHMLTALIKEGTIEKTYVKKVAYFSITD